MKNLQLDDKTAREIYPTSPPAMKVLLEENWGKAFFAQSLMERIKNWKDVAAEYGKDPDRWLPFPNPSDQDEAAENAHWRIMKTKKLFKEGKKFDYSNTNQGKYYGWWKWLGSGFGFSYTGTDYVNTRTAVGPRLCSFSHEIEKYICTVVCAEDYKIYHTE